MVAELRQNQSRVANDANIVTEGLSSVGKGNVDRLQVALTVMICAQDNRHRTAESTPVREGPFAVERLRFCP